MRVTGFNKNNKTAAYFRVCFALLMLSAFCGPGTAADLPSINVLEARIKTAAPAVNPGQSATLLPDGRWLLLGGMEKDGRASDKAVLFDPGTKQRTPISARLKIGRAYHTASVLPDGSVLIVGGEDGGGMPLGVAERYRLETGGFDALDDLRLDARSRHSATLLADGNLLIAGGVGAAGEIRDNAMRIDMSTLRAAPLPAHLNGARYEHSAALLPSGYVLLWKGSDNNRHTAGEAELYDSRQARFLQLDEAPAAALPTQAYRLTEPGVQAVLPQDGSRDVAVDARIAVRFNKPLPPGHVNPRTFTLVGPRGPVETQVVAAEGGLLAFLTPRQQLLPGSRHTLLIEGLKDAKGRRIPFTAVSFHTKVLNAAAAASAAQSGADAPTVDAYSGATLLQDDAAVHGGAVSAADGMETSPLVLSAELSSHASAADNDEVFTPGEQHRGGR